MYALTDLQDMRRDALDMQVAAVVASYSCPADMPFADEYYIALQWLRVIDAMILAHPDA